MSDSAKPSRFAPGGLPKPESPPAVDLENPFEDGGEGIDTVWARAEAALPATPQKRLVTLRLDEDVVLWFKSLGKGYQGRINTVLRSFKRACERRERP
jgi:uncharacterized protein (DUF4415 family)